MTLKLTNSNYYSDEANDEYISVSQFKDFIKCEWNALAKLAGEPEEDKTALLVGNYVHSYFESPEEHDRFKKENESVIFKKNGTMYAPFEQAQSMVERLEQDDFFKFVYQGEKEVIVTGELYGAKWKGKIDLLNKEKGYFVDLKTTREMGKRYWSDKYGRYVSFVEMYDYILQMYIYKQLLEQQYGIEFTPYIFAVSKETPTNIQAIRINDDKYLAEEEYIQKHIQRVIDLKKGNALPEGCGKCPYCIKNKRLENFIEVDDLLG